MNGIKNQRAKTYDTPCRYLSHYKISMVIDENRKNPFQASKFIENTTYLYKTWYLSVITL